MFIEQRLTQLITEVEDIQKRLLIAENKNRRLAEELAETKRELALLQEKDRQRLEKDAFRQKTEKCKALLMEIFGSEVTTRIVDKPAPGSKQTGGQNMQAKDVTPASRDKDQHTTAETQPGINRNCKNPGMTPPVKRSRLISVTPLLSIQEAPAQRTTTLEPDFGPLRDARCDYEWTMNPGPVSKNSAEEMNVVGTDKETEPETENWRNRSDPLANDSGSPRSGHREYRVSATNSAGIICPDADTVIKELRKNVCTTCGESFRTESGLTRHEILHSNLNLRRYKCDHCDKAYPFWTQLRKHLEYHTWSRTTKRIPCKYCNRKFLRRTDLTYHERLHTGVRPFVCTTCNKSYVKMSALTNHIRRHLNSNH